MSRAWKDIKVDEAEEDNNEEGPLTRKKVEDIDTKKTNNGHGNILLDILDG